MTAIPSQMTKSKDPFQMELDREISKRRSKGLVTGFSDSDEEEAEDDYEEDFVSEDSSDDDLLKQYLKPTGKSTKPTLYEDQKSSLRMKENLSSDRSFMKDFNQSSTKTPQKSLRDGLGRQHALDDTNKSMEDNPLLSLLDGAPHSGVTRVEKRKPLSPHHSGSPSLHSQYPDLNQTGFLRKTGTFSHNARPLSPSVDFQTTPRKKSDLSIQNDIVSPRHQENLHAKDLTSLTSKETKTFSTQSIIDDLLSNTKPTAAPRKKSSYDADLDRSSSRTRSRHSSGKSTGSEKSVKRSNAESPEHQLKSIENMSQKRSSQDFLSTLPSLDKSAGRQKEQKSLFSQKSESQVPEQSQTRSSISKPKPALRSSKELNKSVEENKPTGADDLVALFEQAATIDSTAQKKTVTILEKEDEQQRLEPSEIVAEQTQRESNSDVSKQRSSQQLITNVIDNVAQHNQTYASRKDEEIQREEEQAETKPKRPSSARIKSSKKSPRHPPANYKGLGSLTALNQLQTYKVSSDTHELNSTSDIRTQAYMSWLADREKILKKQKKLKQEAEEKENEGKEKELKEKELEGESARRAWLQHKEGVFKAAEKKKQKEKRDARREKLKLEEERWKSEKKGDVVRQRALDEAKKRHKEELKKKREEELLKKKKEQEKKRENQKAVNEWTEKRSKQWEKDRQKEMREKRKIENEKKKSQEKKSEVANETYQKWQEKKEQQMRESRRMNYHDEDRPPWSPANKVVPRRR